MHAVDRYLCSRAMQHAMHWQARTRMLCCCPSRVVAECARASWPLFQTAGMFHGASAVFQMLTQSRYIWCSSSGRPANELSSGLQRMVSCCVQLPMHWQALHASKLHEHNAYSLARVCAACAQAGAAGTLSRQSRARQALLRADLP